MTEYLHASLYTDGGCIGANPSPIGGAWAWCLVRDGVKVKHDSDIIVAGEDCHPDEITNNYTELYAAVMGLEAMGKNWRGTLYTDSLVTKSRITDGVSFNGIPNSLRSAILDLRRGRRYKVVLLAGHPTRKELAAGVARRNGNPVSKWNVWCDRECNRLAEAHKP